MTSRPSQPKRRHQRGTRSKSDVGSITDAYGQVPPSQLDNELSLIKADFSSWQTSNTATYPSSEINQSSSMLPPWLQNTIKTLEPGHPAKLLLLRSPSPASSIPRPHWSPVGGSLRFASPHPTFTNERRPLPVVYPSPQQTEHAIVTEVVESLIADANTLPPFSTPGPGSALVYPLSPEQLLDDPPRSRMTFGRPPSPYLESPFMHYQSPDNTEHARSDDLLDFEPFYEPNTDESTSEPELQEPPAHILPLFSTPLLDDRDSPFQYFDSPFEDPCEADMNTIDPHCDEVEFCWEPYDRKRDFLEHRPPNPRIAPLENFDDIWQDGTGDYSLTKIKSLENSGLLPAPSLAGIFRYGPPDLDNQEPLGDNSANPSYDPPAPDATKSKPIFAPAPGIFLSPLQSHQSSSSSVDNVGEKHSALLQLLDSIGPTHTSF
ncbi:hypothetical protein BDN72DRAFT_893489 [Pluteus cervinus]|uniref:Uncharacterized protein n=1 Tax=Pluteus cervinus TaxID=181527 RepID=A0ACD3B8Y6_9AGAR|nr:hypothetical protein BDN72DRAFT_893489 [Pluteus cervinus]